MDFLRRLTVPQMIALVVLVLVILIGGIVMTMSGGDDGDFYPSPTPRISGGSTVEFIDLTPAAPVTPAN